MDFMWNINSCPNPGKHHLFAVSSMAMSTCVTFVTMTVQYPSHNAENLNQIIFFCCKCWSQLRCEKKFILYFWQHVYFCQFFLCHRRTMRYKGFCTKIVSIIGLRPLSEQLYTDGL